MHHASHFNTFIYGTHTPWRYVQIMAILKKKEGNLKTIVCKKVNINKIPTNFANVAVTLYFGYV